MKKYFGLFLVLLLFLLAIVLFKKNQEAIPTPAQISSNNIPTTSPLYNPLDISEMRKREYPGSDLIIEETLDPGSNYHRYIASYQSDGLKIYGLLTVPTSAIPKGGFPAIVFNHGFIPPKEYRTTERYVAYVDAFARAGYVVFKPDYRGNGNSEGSPEGAYYSPAYTVDVLNALTSLKKYSAVNPQKIGMWGHSMGGNITLRSLVVRPQEIKAAVIWAGVVGSYDDLINNWQRKVRYQPPPQELALRNRHLQELIKKIGTPTTNPGFWNAMDPTFFVKDIQVPAALHHGTTDEEVPLLFSQKLNELLQKAGKYVVFYTYEGADHNISSPAFELAMQRSIAFFDLYLKGSK